MGLESSVDKVADLNDAWPLGTDPKSQGDDHIRFCKKAMLSGDFSGIDLLADNISDAGGNLRQAFSNPNLIINGDMSVWQRGTTFVPPTPTYTADRWHTVSATSTVNRQAWSGGNAVYCIDVLNTTAGGKICQPVELLAVANARPFVQGSTWTVSFEAASATTDTAGVFVDFTDNSAGDNSITIALANNLGTITSTPQVFSHTFTIGVDPIGTTATMRVFVGGETPNQSVYITNVKLERGSVATPFIPDDHATNLAKCQRYYQTHEVIWLSENTNQTGASRAAGFGRSVVMRITPTESGTGANCTPVFNGTKDAVLVASSSGITTPANGSAVSNYTADAEL